MNPNDFLIPVIFIEILAGGYACLAMLEPDVACARHEWYWKRLKRYLKITFKCGGKNNG